MKDVDVNEMASLLGRMLTVFQMEATIGVPAPLLASQVRLVAEAALHLLDALEADPHIEVTLDPFLSPRIESLYTQALTGFHPGMVPDTIEPLED